MAAVEEFLSEGAQAVKRRKRMILTILLVVIGLHVFGGAVAGVLVIARYIFPPPANFVVKKDIRLPAKEREHKMNMAAFDAMTPKPSFNDKMQSMQPAPFALPDLPNLPLDQMMPLDPSAIVSDQVSSLVGTAGLGGGGEGAGGLGGTGTGFSFLGVKASGTRILLIFDVSKSVVTKAAASGVPLSRIKEETLALIDKLPSTSRFGILQFTQNYKPFREELIPATDQNREEVRAWVRDEWTEVGMLSGNGVVTNPRGIIGVLELVSKMQPDVIFLISDGSFQWRPDGAIKNIPWKDFSDAVRLIKGEDSKPVPLYVFTFQSKPNDRQELRRITGRTGGKLRELK